MGSWPIQGSGWVLKGLGGSWCAGNPGGARFNPRTLELGHLWWGASVPYVSGQLPLCFWKGSGVQSLVVSWSFVSVGGGVRLCFWAQLEVTLLSSAHTLVAWLAVLVRCKMQLSALLETQEDHFELVLRLHFVKMFSGQIMNKRCSPTSAHWENSICYWNFIKYWTGFNVTTLSKGQLHKQNKTLWK